MPSKSVDDISDGDGDGGSGGSVDGGGEGGVSAGNGGGVGGGGGPCIDQGPLRRNCPSSPHIQPKIRFLNVSSTVCVPGQSVDSTLDAIVIVKSAVYNFADRDRIRRVYAKGTHRDSEFRIAIVFSVGLPRSSGGRFFQRDGFNISLPDRAGEAMEKMKTRRSEVLRNLTEEARVNGELVLGDYEDIYYKLSPKLFHTFQWASHFCLPHFTSQKRLPVFIYIDDDFAFNVGLLKAELRVLTDTQIRRVTWGFLHNHMKVRRVIPLKVTSKWFVSKREVPWSYHAPFAAGQFYVMGADVLQEIAIAMYFTLQFPIDDAWLGLVMAKFLRTSDLYVFIFSMASPARSGSEMLNPSRWKNRPPLLRGRPTEKTTAMRNSGSR
nr:unnamed protein product [Spirometra erinaceieuropaei]